MSRSRTRVPGRYERPAATRPALGDQAGEAGAREGFRAALRVKPLQPNRRPPAAERVTFNGVDITDYLTTADQHRLQPVRTLESAATVERVDLVETVEAGHAIREASSKGGPKGSVISVDVIRSGWNKSGSRYYPADVLERDVPKVYPAGCHMYVNHPSATERDDQPERTLQTLAATFLEPPHAVQEDGGGIVMRTTARVFSDWQGFLAERADVIGVSINGGGEAEWGEREGRHGLILESLTSGQSVDFVTKPGAGGKILALLESHRPLSTVEAGTLGGWLEAQMHLGFTQLADQMYGDGRLTRDERIAASSAVGDALTAFVAAIEAKAPDLYKRERWAIPEGASAATREALTVEASAEQTRDQIERAVCAAHGGEKKYAYVLDYDPDAGTVWFRAENADEQGRIYQQAYTHGGAIPVALVGDPVEVRPRTVYEPVAAGGDQVTTKESPDGADAPAGSITATEADTTARENVMGDVNTREAAEATRTAESLELARFRVADKASGMVETKLSESDLPVPAQARIRAQFRPSALPLVESDRSLDETALSTTVEAAITAEKAYVAQILESAGVGRVAGNGAAPGAGGGMPAAFGASRNTSTTEADTATVEALTQQYKARGMNDAAAAAAARGRN